MKRWFPGLAPCVARHAVLIAMAVALPSSASLAQGTRAQRIACTSDVWRLCSAAIPSVDRIVACLKREKSNLSPACAAVFNDPQVQTAINRRQAAPPSEPAPHAQPQQTAVAPAEPAAPPAPVAAAPAPTAEVASHAPAAQPEVVTRSLSTAQPEEAAVTPAAPPAQSAVTSAPQPAPSTAVRAPQAAPTTRLAARGVDTTERVTSRYARRQQQASYQTGRQAGLSQGRQSRRGGGIMAQIAPLIAMAMSNGQGGGFDVGSMMGGYGGGQGGNIDVGQIMGMARSMGFDPSAFMGGGGGGNWR
jgi:hypothetical protein